MNNLYLVVSKELSEIIPILESFDSDVRDMPKFWVRKIGKTKKPPNTVIDAFDDDPS